MKKIFKISLLLVMVITMMLITTFSASAVESVDDAEVTDEAVPTEERVTVFSRIYEFFTDNAEKIIGCLNLAVLTAAAVFIKKKGNVIISGIVKMISGQSGVVSASENSEKAMTALAEEQTHTGERLAALEKAEEERDKMTKALLYEVMTLIQMKHTLALNNANIPQPIKNYTTALCANCFSALENDEELRRAYDEIREILGIKKDGAENEKEDS